MFRKIDPVVLLLVMVATACGVQAFPPTEPADKIFTVIPEDIDPDVRYLFYLHGAIIERAGVRPTHPKFGIYEYQDILDVFAGRGFVVISEARAAGTDAVAYAGAVADQVRTLLLAGVPPRQITVVGFSKGGGIAVVASSILANDGVNFVFMGTCGSWLDQRPEIAPHGRLLSLHEASDDMVGSCEILFSRAENGCVHREIVIDIGGGHGAFYRPRPEWIEPAIEWATGRSF